ncbi:MAG: hypothetical protein AB1656_01410 [Candidatus Omnitrophota bacterium]
MTGFLQYSFRLFRDRRAAYGAWLVMLLSYAAAIYLSSAIDGRFSILRRMPEAIALAASFWPAVWGAVFAAALLHDEHSRGTLETLMTLPLSPHRLTIAIAVAPAVMTAALFIAVAPAPLLCLSTLESAPDIRKIALFFLIAFLVAEYAIWRAIHAGALGIPLGSNIMNTINGTAIVYYFLLLIVYSPIFTGPRMFFAFLLILFIPSLFHRKSPTEKLFDLERLERLADPHPTTIAGLFAFLRRREKTIFPKEDDGSKYMTLETIRQQTLGGPLHRLESVKGVALFGLVIFLPILTLLAIFDHKTSLIVLQFVYAIALAVSAFYAASYVMRETLDERRSLRLDSMRITLIPLSEILEVKEYLTLLLPNAALKWLFGYVALLALLSDPLGAIPFLAAAAIYGLQGWLMLRIAARLGIRIGLSAKDDLEGVLWSASTLAAWMLLPMGLTSIPPHPAWASSFACLSPIGLIYSVLMDYASLPVYSIALLALGLEWIVLQWLGQRNRYRLLSPWAYGS